jgi:ribonuclease Z
LPGMLMSLQLAARQRPLRLAGPPGLREYVTEVSRLIQTGYGYTLEFVEVDGSSTVLEAPQFAVTTAPLDHRIATVGYRFQESDAPGHLDVQEAERLGLAPGPVLGRLQRGETVQTERGTVVRPEQVLGPPRRGRSVAYCSDTRPCEAGVELGRAADLLIHDSTFLAEREDDARETGHSTAAQAASVALRAGARRLILTHFSARYADAGPLVDEARRIFPNVEAARELVAYSL